MNKGLEALKELPATTLEEAEAVDVIEQELKDKEDYDKLCEEFRVSFPQLREALVLYRCFDIESNNKKLKALELIKEKCVVSFAKENPKDDFARTRYTTDNYYKTVSDEEYDLLKGELTHEPRN